MNINIIDITVRPMTSDGKYAVEYVDKNSFGGQRIWWESSTSSIEDAIKYAVQRNRQPVTSIAVYGEENGESKLAAIATWGVVN